MPNYTKLFSTIVTSTIWQETDRTRIVWITMLALSDKNGEIHASIPGLARIAGVPTADCETAINAFLSSDAYSRTPEHEGRRIAKIDGGWELLNFQKYRLLASTADTLAKNATRQKRFRDRNGKVTDSNASVTPSNGGVTVDTLKAEAEAEADSNTNSDSKANTEAHPKAKEPKQRLAARDCSTETFPASLDTQSFREAWETFCQHRKEIKKPFTKTSAEAAIKKLETIGESRAITALKHSTENGWQGIFEPTLNPTQAKKAELEANRMAPSDWGA